MDEDPVRGTSEKEQNDAADTVRRECAAQEVIFCRTDDVDETVDVLGSCFGVGAIN